MIYLRDDVRITKGQFFSKDDEKLINFVLENAKREFKNLELISSKKVGRRDFYTDWTSYGLIQKIDVGDFNIRRFNDFNEFKFKKLTTLKIAIEALRNSGVEIPEGIYIEPSNVLFLDNFFKNGEQDMQMIESIVDNPYFYEFLEKMYCDYNGFLQIIPYIGFDIVDYYLTIESLCDSREYEKRRYGGTTAINNHKILTRTKKIINDLSNK